METLRFVASAVGLIVLTEFGLIIGLILFYVLRELIRRRYDR